MSKFTIACVSLERAIRIAGADTDCGERRRIALCRLLLDVPEYRPGWHALHIILQMICFRVERGRSDVSMKRERTEPLLDPGQVRRRNCLRHL